MKAILQNHHAALVLSFLCVLVTYGLYAGVVVPMMFARDPQFAEVVEEVGRSDVEESEWKQYVNSLFKEGDWERECKYSIWKDDYIILFNEYRSQDKQTELTPCTVLFLTGEQAVEEEDENLEQLFQQSIILKSSKGAVIDFDAPFSPIANNKAKFAKGRLTGNVSIRSDMKNPGSEDDLEILSGEVIFNEKQIQSNSDLRFKFGKNHGSGKQFYMFLEPSDPKNSKSAKTISGLELHQVNKIYLYTPVRQAKNDVSGSSNNPMQEQFDTFEITCRGKIEFCPDPNSDLHWIGRFNNDVDIARVNTGYDRLTCSRLIVVFSPQPKPGEQAKKNNDLDSLQQLAPLIMLAEGNTEGKARVRSPNNNDFLAEGEIIEYDFEGNRITLDCGNGEQQTVLLSMYGGRQTATGKRMSYIMGENGKFGELLVPDGGTMQGFMSPQAQGSKDQRKFRLDWINKLQAAPDPDDPSQIRCELFGMKVQLENLAFTADEAVIWFNQKGIDKEPSKSSVLPFSRPRSASNDSIPQPIFTLSRLITPHDFSLERNHVSLGNYVHPMEYGNFRIAASPVRWTAGKPVLPANYPTNSSVYPVQHVQQPSQQSRPQSNQPLYLSQSPSNHSRYARNRQTDLSTQFLESSTQNEVRIALRTDNTNHDNNTTGQGAVRPVPNTITLSPTAQPPTAQPPTAQPPTAPTMQLKNGNLPNSPPLSVPVPAHTEVQPFSLPSSALPLSTLPPSASVNMPIGSSSIPLKATTASTPSVNTETDKRDENPLSQGFSSLVPDRAKIRKNVQFVTSNGVCDVQELDIWFEDEDGSGLYNTIFSESLNFADPPQSDSLPENAANNQKPQEKTENGNTAPDTKNRSFFGQPQDGEASQFKLEGDSMQVLVKMQGRAMNIEKLHLNGIVSDSDHKDKIITLKEINPKQGTAPIQAEGVELRAWNPSSDRSIVQLIGTPRSPAIFQGMESSMTGLNMIVNQQTNHFSIEGPGQITTRQFTISKSAFSPFSGSRENNTAPRPKEKSPENSVDPSRKKLLVVRWAGRMNFDGTRISFEKNVRAVYPLQQLSCNVLNLDLDQRVSFLQQKLDRDPEVKMFECLGKVCFEYQEVEDETQLESPCKSILQGENLERVRIFPETGRFFGTAFGMEQGRLKATFRDEGKGLGFDLNPSAAERPRTGLSRIDIRFYDTITGNYKNFEATATGQVACIHAGVPAWDTQINIDDRDKLKEIDGYRLDCDTLEVAKAIDPLSLKEGVELTASGATRIEGRQFFARGDSVKFNQIKETVILQGRGPVNAEIHLQRSSNDDFEEPIFAQQIEYNLRTRKTNFIAPKVRF